MPRDLSHEPAAVRMRNLRQRRRMGAFVVAVEITPDTVEWLIAVGLIEPEAASDRIRIRTAISELLQDGVPLR